ncbi:MAG TPA: hypothetical protein DDZ51_29840 [Planctomycetaceae bacterium]|nr:hypothetical protein [Planctomycetaceae bacterium]
MAKKTSGPNKSQAIREYYEAHPDAKPKAVVEALAAKGVVVTPAFVSTIKSTSINKGAKPAAKGKRGPKPGASVKAPKVAAAKPAAAKSTGGVSIDTLIKAKSLVKELGGIENAMSALAALKRLAD